MIGKIEQENKIRVKINEKLSGLPYIFKAFYDYMESDQKSYSTMKHYIEYVSDFMDFVTQGKSDGEFYKNVTVPQIREYIVSLRRRGDNGEEIKNSDSIQATRWSAINTFYNFLVLDDYININPMTKTKRPKNRKQNEIVYLEKDEIDQIIEKIKDEAQDKMINRDIAFVTLGITTGLRVGALLNINVSDINWQTNEIETVEKGGKTRLIKFGDKTKAVLAQWLMDRSSYFENLETDALFISQWKQRLSPEGARQLFKKYTKDLPKHITIHTLRKTCATQSYLAGADIRTIAGQLGHSSPNTTMRYAAAVDSKRDEMINNLENNLF